MSYDFRPTFTILASLAPFEVARFPAILTRSASEETSYDFQPTFTILASLALRVSIFVAFSRLISRYARASKLAPRVRISDPMILLIDNYDSFAFNLQRYLVRLGQQVRVVRNDDAILTESLGGPSFAMGQRQMDLLGNPKAIVISPGPKRPSDAGHCLDLVRCLSGVLPILGVCLGHQIICEALGSRIIRAQKPIHGRATPIELEDCRLFHGLGSGPGKRKVDFGRYHSLVAEPATLAMCLRVTAWSIEGEIMAVEHRQHATFGIQFHPESILSREG